MIPASRTIRSAQTLNISASNAWLSDWHSALEAPMAWALASNSNSRPPASTVPLWRYQAKPSTPTWVITPPKQP